MFCQEDYIAEGYDEDHCTLNYITSHIEKPGHEGCVFLRLSDCSSDAEGYVLKKHPDRRYLECWVEVPVPTDEIKEIRKIMQRLLKKSQESGW